MGLGLGMGWVFGLGIGLEIGIRFRARCGFGLIYFNLSVPELKVCPYRKEQVIRIDFINITDYSPI